MHEPAQLSLQLFRRQGLSAVAERALCSLRIRRGPLRVVLRGRLSTGYGVCLECNVRPRLRLGRSPLLSELRTQLYGGARALRTRGRLLFGAPLRRAYGDLSAQLNERYLNKGPRHSAHRPLEAWRPSAARPSDAHRVAAEKVSHWFGCPVSNPRRNQRERCSDEP